MKLSRWKCNTCGFQWFEQLQTSETVPLIDHGCPQGCDDAVRIIGEVVATAKDGEWIVPTMRNAQVDEAAECLCVNRESLA
jgi:hypothetical protein